MWYRVRAQPRTVGGLLSHRARRLPRSKSQRRASPGAAQALEGVSESIVAGVPPRVGTNYGYCYLDKEMEQEHKVEPPSEWVDMEEDDEPWLKPWESEPTADPFVGGEHQPTWLQPQAQTFGQGMFYQPQNHL